MDIQTKKLYDTDYNLWLLTTAQLLRERQLDQIDYENLIEDLEAMVRSDKNALFNNLKQLLMHLLKWEFQASKRKNSWRYSIVEHCQRINKAFKDSASLKPYFNEIFDECYEKARSLASAETGIPKKDFPVECPFTKEYVLDAENLFVVGEDE
ncbi:DUF29 domain-containing protein [Gloeothece verrucosa]|uniref:DUF29 domain-containing protein n=1 Tax=Gloeothece verrucosa (strain PCC 7822) TaxID=497965 RepID=E0UDB6_GLOV7|nr:DUF29 domain-containing protein [Gloeothece verrucosa]ADN14107.1 protein of unknown function DUF29 [Gloeothece verrucosa PCC 7822]